MRILVLQLARFGDIYQTWPTLNALRRLNPDCELHVLVRSRFKAALDGFPNIIVHELTTPEILRPLIEAEVGDGRADIEARSRLLDVLNPLETLRFDRIVNLSFSPVASYLTDFIANEASVVTGYTRYNDGHLNIPDDASAYFFAQVGVGKSNRHHVTELFAAVAGIDLLPADFTNHLSPDATASNGGVLVHVGASSAAKVYAPELWVEALRTLRRTFEGQLTLIGSSAEREIGETICRQLQNANVQNKIGQTSLSELKALIASADLLIGSDSAPIHIAALSGTVVLNLSSSAVNFWETGPLSVGSRVLFSADLQNLNPSLVAAEALHLLKGSPPTAQCAERTGLLEPYVLHGLRYEDRAWRLINALYSGAPYPAFESRADLLAIRRLAELAELALAQLDRWDDTRPSNLAVSILEQVDQLIPEVGRLNPQVDPLVQWFQTERLRIPPGAVEAILDRTRSLFEELKLICSVYREAVPLAENLRKAQDLCVQCVPEVREYKISDVQSSFQTLITILVDFAARSTKVADLEWSNVLGAVNANLERGDYIALADLLEWTLAPAFARHLSET